MARPRPVATVMPRAGGRLSPRAFVLGAVLVVVLLRLPFAFAPLRSDEGGYLLVARAWHSGGDYLYGDYYVDRPPLLLAVFRLVAPVEWSGAIRVLALLFAVAFVVAAARTGHLLAGDAGARWATVVAAALATSPALAADQADGELLAAPFVLGSIALVLEAWTAAPGRRRTALAAAAGVCAGAAPLVKQSFLEGLVFTTVLVAGTVLVRRRADPRALSLLAGFGAGALLPHLVVAAGAHAAGSDAHRLWTELAGFRGSAFSVIWRGHTDAPVERGLTLVALGLATGVLPLLATWAWASRRPGFTRVPLAWATSAALAYGLVAIGAGGSYWPHYLLQLGPALVVVASLGATRPGRDGVWARRSARLLAGSAVVATVVVAVGYATTPWTWHQQRTGEWLAASGHAGDTAVVTYGNASILEYAGMPSPYPHLWSLPLRTLDPDLALLESVLEGDDAPIWIVEVNDPGTWDLDADGSVRRVVDERYDVVGQVCGHPVQLRSDVHRELAPPPRC